MQPSLGKQHISNLTAAVMSILIEYCEYSTSVVVFCSYEH